MQTDARGPTVAAHQPRSDPPRRWPRLPGWLRWAAVLACGLVGALAVITGWGPLLLWLAAAAAAVVGFLSRRDRWWGLALCAAAVVVVIAVPAEVSLRVQVVASVAAFAAVAAAWLGIRRGRLFGPGGLLRRPAPSSSFPGWRLVFVAPLVAALVLVFALFGALAAPGNQSLEAKWADWLRGHHAVGLASDLEKYYYQHNAPKRGGRISHLNAIPHARSVPAVKATDNTFLPPPAPVPLVVRPGLPGEGRWAPTGPLVNGHAGLYVSQFRADTIYTGQITSAVWIDPKIVQVSLVPGTQEPGGVWPQLPYVPATQLSHLVGAFNGGFRLQDAHG
ncbi:MAG: hypothetical protein J2P57_06940, partial [Acidimicrobiaceae bacterium]|nr:hypothetical protein [Acidimicrobiaceae bacterium]